uniref:CRAL-TRIO domain-containing protein n=1 Tax=Grammatophora oceanica TaxID=210454 RepID=A0A7S1UYX5_9STRA|mmetsp:Transcript_27428/g.40248  ORF Transcript_27428/g.40248 Transcript_27428/m.40248 type:complete len:288 (+) Transcript_27428:117-980(+)|eukprot:CAMPEP_0194046690 /NCGR_PEP_ID=MMETSP0009_2-20130614/22245_1 /TAXON_ID=210454 /ORGANISM="Grammatophora oceanica, Strain CCMP 410" /LENGTH=287 /DNA_ID=CAMNT_0038692085 /DNA_START=97 /DNA_END=960 /DNA_ORIENTATION=-
MSNPNIEMTEPDAFGQKHPIESEELIATGLKELELEVSKLPDDDRAAWEEAKVKCASELIDDKFLLQFLRAEVFNADLAAKRLCGYWTKRLSAFGPDKAFLPMTLDQALKDDDFPLRMGFATLVPATDPVGRSILFFDPSKNDRTKYSIESLTRAVWYYMHAALESETAQQKGVVFMIYPQKAKLSQFDRGLANSVMSSLKLCMPVRVSALMICHPPFFFSIVFSVVKVFMGERVRKRVRVMSGSQISVMEELQVLGLTADRLPTELGGAIELNATKYVDERKAAGK